MSDNETETSDSSSWLNSAGSAVGGFYSRHSTGINVAAIAVVMLTALATPAAAQSCPLDSLGSADSGDGSALGQFIDNAVTLIVVVGTLAALGATAGAWGMSTMKKDPQEKQQYTQWRNSSAKALFGLAGFSILFDVALNLLPGGAGDGVASCVDVFSFSGLGYVAVDAASVAASVAVDVVPLLA